MCDRGGVRKDGGVENAIISVCLYRTFNPLARWALPLYRCGAPRNATGYGRGEGGVHFFILSVVFISLFPLCPVVLRGGREIGETPQKW